MTNSNDTIRTNTVAGAAPTVASTSGSEGSSVYESGARSTTRDDSGMLTGLFRDRESAERAYHSLSERGYDKKDVNLVMSDETRKRHFSGDDSAQTELGSKAAEGAGIGGAIGGTLGAIAAALAGAGAGGVTGGLLGALIGWGIPEERVKHYESGISEGGILMGVKPRSADDAQYLEEQWKANRGEHVYR